MTPGDQNSSPTIESIIESTVQSMVRSRVQSPGFAVFPVGGGGKSSKLSLSSNSLQSLVYRGVTPLKIMLKLTWKAILQQS